MIGQPTTRPSLAPFPDLPIMIGM